MLISHALHHLPTSEVEASSNHTVKTGSTEIQIQPKAPLPLPPKKEATAEAGYLIPAQGLLEGMEKEQLALEIRKKRNG